MKRKFLVAAGALLVAALGLYWFGQWRIAARRLAAWEAERVEEVVPSVVYESVAWDHAQITLAQFADLLMARTGLSVEFDEAGTGKKKPRELKVTVPRGEFSPEQVLSMVLAPVGLAADVRGPRIVVASITKFERGRLRSVVYPVPQPKPAGMSESDWQQLIEMNIFGHAVEVPGAIIVVADGANQRRARLVIDTICELREPVAASAAEPVTIPPAATSEMEQRIRGELDRATNIDFVETPLKDAMLYLAELHRIPLIVRGDKLGEASVSANTPITKSLRGISLRSALHLMLKDLELTFVIRDQAIVITTPEDAEWRMRTVAWLIGEQRIGEELIPDKLIKDQADFEALEKVVVSSIDPGCWRVFGGPGLIHRVDGRWLVVQQSSSIIDQVGFLLHTLRQMLASEQHSASRSIVPSHAAEEAIRAALQRPIALNFQQMPLKDVMLYIGEELKIPLIVSVKKLEEASVSPDTPITYKTSPIPAKTALEDLLKFAALDFLIRDEVLQITTPEDTESQLITRVYDTRTILKRMSPEQLRERITTTIRPNSWLPAVVPYGPGEMEFYRGLLVVTQIERAQEEIERMIESLTAAPAEAK